MKSEDIIEITLKFPFGKGASSSTASCLIRPFLKLFYTGKPVGKINYIFYHHVNGNYYNLGSLCYTEGRRILFFPGFQARNLLWLLNKKGDFKKFNFTDFLVDHFTLERNLSKSHLTLSKNGKIDEKEYPISLPTWRLKKDLIFWFGLSVQDPSFLELTPEMLTISFSSISTDSKRRIKNIVEARKESVFHIVQLPSESYFEKNEFIHFNFFICSKDFNIPEEHAMTSLPTKEPIVSGFQFKDIYPFRSHPVSLPGIDKIIGVTVSKHKGILRNKIIFAMYEGTN